MSKPLTCALLAFAMLASPKVAGAQAATVFRGVPSIKITEGGLDRHPESVTAATAGNVSCVISRIGDKYYWASRENTELVRIQAGAFITYVALNGTGYVRIVSPAMKSTASLMGQTEQQFDYVEHIVFGLRSVTYYGTTRSLE